MVDPIRDNDTRGGRRLERHTGSDALIKIKRDDPVGGEQDSFELPVTSVDWSREFSSEAIQHTGSLEPTLTTTELRYSGSFEYEGQIPEFASAVLIDGSADDYSHIDKNRPARFKLTVNEYNHEPGDEIVYTVVFKRCMVTSMDRDVSTGDITTHSFDWEAETVEWYEGTAE